MNKDNTKSIIDELKKISKKLVKSLIKRYFIIVLVVFILVVILLSSFIIVIKLDDGKYYEGESEEKKVKNVPYTVSEYLKNITFSGTEGIIVKDDQGNNISIDDVWNKLVENGSDIKNYLSNSEDLKKLIEAEVITQYPKIKGLNNNYLNGSITFEKHTSDGKNVILQYIDKNEFDEKVNNKDKNISNYYTLDDNKNVLIGYFEINTETLKTNDTDVDISEYSNLTEDNKKNDDTYYKEEYNIKTMSIPYINLISQYRMPFQYLWSLLVISNDREFVLELANLVEKSDIIISVFDNTTTYVTNDNFTYNKMMRTDTFAKVKPDNDYGITGYPTDRKWADEDENNVDDSMYPATYSMDETEYNVVDIKTTETNMPFLTVTKADIWCLNMSKEYYNRSNNNDSNELNETKLEDTKFVKMENFMETSDANTELLKNDKAENLAKEVEEYIKKKIKEKSNEDKDITVNVTYVENKYYQQNINRKHANSSSTTSTEYVAGTEEKKLKVDVKSEQPNFVTILNKSDYRYTKRILTDSATDLLFELLENNPDTVNMVELTKYLFYKATNDNSFWNGSDYDFSIYDSKSFSSLDNGIYGGTIQEKVWFALKNLGYSDISIAGAMGNIHYESGNFDPLKIESGFTEENGGIGICQWTNNKRGTEGRNRAIREYATRNGKDWRDEDIQVSFLIAELTIGGGADGLASYQLLDKKKSYGTSLACADGWKNAKTVDDATIAFCYSFERPNVIAASRSLAQRKTYAQNYYDQFHDREAPISINTILTGESKNKVEKLLIEAQRIANDNNYTYSQNNRMGEYQYDCSSLVYRLYKKYFNIEVPINTASYTEKYRVGSATTVKLQSGDVLWRQGHVIIYIGEGKFVAAQGDKLPIPDQIKVYNDNVANYTYVYRFITQ